MLFRSREAGISAHPERLDDGRVMEYAFSMMPNYTKEMAEKYAFGPSKDAFMGREEKTTGMDIDRLVNAHGQKFAPNERMVSGSAMEYQSKYPLNSAEKQAAAIMDMNRNLATRRRLASEDKTQGEIRRDQMTGPDAERRAREADEAERLDARDVENESDEYYSEQEKKNRKPSEPFTGETQRLRDMANRKKNLDRSSKKSQKKKRRNIGVYRRKKKDEEKE